MSFFILISTFLANFETAVYSTQLFGMLYITWWRYIAGKSTVNQWRLIPSPNLIFLIDMHTVRYSTMYALTMKRTHFQKWGLCATSRFFKPSSMCLMCIIVCSTYFQCFVLGHSWLQSGGDDGCFLCTLWAHTVRMLLSQHAPLLTFLT